MTFEDEVEQIKGWFLWLTASGHRRGEGRVSGTFLPRPRPRLQHPIPAHPMLLSALQSPVPAVWSGSLSWARGGVELYMDTRPQTGSVPPRTSGGAGRGRA